MGIIRRLFPLSRRLLLFLLAGLFLLLLWLLFLFFRTPPSMPSPEPAPLPATATPILSAAEPAATATVMVEPTPLPPCTDGVCIHELALPDPAGTSLLLTDDSETLDWTVPEPVCLADIAAFLQQEDITFGSISFTLQDSGIPADIGTPIQFEFPASPDPINAPAPDAAVTQCRLQAETGQDVDCHVSVERHAGLPNSNIQMALLLSAMDALRRVHYEDVRQDLEAFYHRPDNLELFHPVIRNENGQWTTRCWDLLD